MRKMLRAKSPRNELKRGGSGPLKRGAAHMCLPNLAGEILLKCKS